MFWFSGQGQGKGPWGLGWAWAGPRQGWAWARAHPGPARAQPGRDGEPTTTHLKAPPTPIVRRDKICRERKPHTLTQARSGSSRKFGVSSMCQDVCRENCLPEAQRWPKKLPRGRTIHFHPLGTRDEPWRPISDTGTLPRLPLCKMQTVEKTDIGLLVFLRPKT